MGRGVEVRTVRGLATTGALVGLGGAALCVTVALVRPGPARRGAPASGAWARDLALPITGLDPERLRSTFGAPRGPRRRHRGIDIPAPRLTPVRAVEPGLVARAGHTGAGGLSLHLVDDEGERCFYYAHLARHAEGMSPGRRVARGEVLGYVGTTGNASGGAPHLHFAIHMRGAGRDACAGPAVDPYPVLRAD
ncbi:MAG TPA: M23 family metallopeptidase [Vicinamibacteria bacterium]|jgi:murein DD-endopeptidase MepM/ murein hydrolase activator NlpD